MEEILASIRRIISEDDAPAASADATAPAAEPETVAAAPEPEPAPEPVAVAAPEVAPEPEPEPAPVLAAFEEDDDDGDLELTERVETHGDLDVYTPPAGLEQPKTMDTLVSEQAASAAASAFGQLSAAMLLPKEGRTLEDLVSEMLRPMLQQWLDANLPAIVQETVTAEVERIARARAR